MNYEACSLHMIKYYYTIGNKRKSLFYNILKKLLNTQHGCEEFNKSVEDKGISFKWRLSIVWRAYSCKV